ncbi:VOC family protein [Asanoa siamensis]|uniref:VOC domain-containing protein n=1 Tax=Asanoa siamensis TaxID=926357 RepID=A0ABQ4CLH6_9ACTN|nr:VOC family protein [Asanoa siamensis]GIF71707.1 hypothetical protein Asi02nite_12250 [Asanoa siamensis]
MTGRRSRLCHFVLDCDDLEQAVRFWSAALEAEEELVAERSHQVYRLLRPPDSEIRILLQHTADPKTSKERMHLDLEADDVEAEVQRLEEFGATRYDHQQARGFDFWVMRDPWSNEFCVLNQSFPISLTVGKRSRPALLTERTAPQGSKSRVVVPGGPSPRSIPACLLSNAHAHGRPAAVGRERCLPEGQARQPHGVSFDFGRHLCLGRP